MEMTKRSSGAEKTIEQGKKLERSEKYLNFQIYKFQIFIKIGKDLSKQRKEIKIKYID